MDLQNGVQSVLDQLVETDKERGLQVAAYLDGELVVDAWAGVVDPRTGTPVKGETLFPVFSVTKGIAATLAHLLVERGKIAYDTPIAEVWPEFAAHGKSGITLRHALNHTAGLANMPTGLDHAALCDWDTMCAKIADSIPTSPPGEVTLYHAITYSWTVGETLHRVDGRSFAQMLEEEICRPLGIDSLFVGLPDAVKSEVALLEAPPRDPAAPPLPENSVASPVPAFVEPLHEWMNRPDARRACIPGSNGIMNARAIARHYAAILPGGVDGIELLPPERIRAALCFADAAAKEPSDHRTLGYASPCGFSSPRAFGHGGHGGSMGFGDPEKRFAFAFVRNRLENAGSLDLIADAFRKAGVFGD